MFTHDRDGLARLCRYGARPPISMERLKRTDDGAPVLGFKRAMADGSSGVRLTPFELLRRLAASIPPPGLLSSEPLESVAFLENEFPRGNFFSANLW